jgi:ABC-type glycerol-3-phosphate transport system substrate-binding protein
LTGLSPTGSSIETCVGSVRRPSSSVLISRLVICALIAVVMVQGHSTAFADEALRFWLVFNLPPAEPAAAQPGLDAFLDRWSRQGVDLYGLRARASANADFRQQLLGQTAILQQLALFRAKDQSFPQIEVTFFGWDEYWESLRSAPAAARPDLVQVPTTWCSSLARGLGVLTALPNELARDASREYAPPTLEPCAVYDDLPLYGLPWLLDVRVLYFWKSDLPTLERELRNSRQPRDSFRQVLQSSRAAVDHPLFGLPTARDWELLHQTALLVWGEGGNFVETHRWFGYRTSSAAFKEPALRGAEYLLGLARDQLIVLPRKTRQDLEREFVNHQLGSVISGPWLLELLARRGQAPQDAIGVVIPPLYERNPVTFVGGSLLGVTGRNPSLKAAALAMAQYLSSGEGALPTAMAVGLLPASTAARGTSAGAARRREALRAGDLCVTYFECLVAAGYPVTIAETFERALAVGRTYPPLPDWWTLEVPSRLGSLYHFWQELAAHQPHDVLEASLQTVSEEWDQSLTAFHRWVLRIATALSITAALLAAVISQTRKSRRALLARQEQLLQSIADLQRQNFEHQPTLDLLKQMLSELQKKDSKIPAIVAPRKQEPDHFKIVLPTHANRSLQIVKNGRCIDGIDAMAARMIERVVRQSLLEQRRASFSLIVAALDSWLTPDTLPKDPRGRWEVIVADMRHAFDSRKWEVISKGRNSVYEFMLDESAYDCYVDESNSGGDGSLFVDNVRAPYLTAAQLAAGDPEAALAHALAALAAEGNLVRKDIEVVVLACRLGHQSAATLTAPQQAILKGAQEELSRVAERYQVFFESYPTLEHLLQMDRRSAKPGDGDLPSHWGALLRTWELIQEAARGMPAIAAPPAAIEKAWRIATQRVESLGPKRARIDDEFVGAFEAIMEYWLEKQRGTVDSVVNLGSRLDPAGKRRHRFKAWVDEACSNAVLDALLERCNGDRAFLLVRLETYLAKDFWKSVHDGSSHILLEMAGEGDVATQARVRDALKLGPAPDDIHACVERIAQIP